MKNNAVVGGIIAAAVVFVMVGTNAYYKTLANAQYQAASGRQMQRDLGEHEPLGAWFMHYPNSGGEHILYFMQKITGKSVGTNYGNVLQETSGALVKDTYASKHVWENHPNGPFKFSDRELPENYVPIATNCGGTCNDCHPQYYILSKYEYLKKCHTGIRFSPFEGGNEESLVYDNTFIKKGLQLVRPPIDNVVARFKQFRKEKVALGDRVWLDAFPDTPLGLKMWCADVANEFREEENIMWDQEVWLSSYGVPCRQEFFRYIQWHNYAHDVTRIDMMDIPVAVVHTQDLQDDFQKHMDSLLWYFRLELTMPLDEYHAIDLDIPSYHDWFTFEEKESIACFMKNLSTDDTIDRLGRYMKECPY
mmetsp:Transcript_44906/g.54398  ORF Transcript_44906/g.54398 Transcript_44906/m.54398 type:complete len:363 (-) Transcript_44906:103-1191(-)|eukprot:CAMPEP_0172512948 /NCGR_PEP_ID=MMETSP1066-20121228/248294_1 /TAXON_ID=671091 /ORGANISM="Coscinodiscus wailesii, Strain CCMP2513" /LENGTH=362 /DNA_ID=CAMNT_0013292973 /DNA_START=151 /DNA_END=1239 /DNA_ORIENTATION=+